VKGEKMRKWIVPSLIVILLLGIVANSFLYVKQAAVIQNDKVLITSLQADVVSTKDGIASLNETTQSLARNVTGLQSSVDGLQTDIASAKDGIASLKEATQSLTGNVSSLQTDVQSFTANLSMLANANVERTVESIYTRVSPSVVTIQVQLQGGGALGSGFVWDSQGDIVTNNHVVDGATSITVTFFDGTTAEASLVGADADSDLAVIKVSANAVQLQPVTMADSTQLKVGQLAIAIGNPFGLKNTVTVGYISALGRILPANENAVGTTYSIPDIIQTDAAINPGNSGGVLLDDTGKVIGVTSSIETTSGSSAGVGFAIPSAIVQQVVPALIKTGHYVHPYLGVEVISLDPALATAMNLSPNQLGALVETVIVGSPADKAGIEASQTPVTINGQQLLVGGDVIIAYNGQTVKSSDDLITFLADTGSVGQTITLTVLRGGHQIQIQVTLGARPSS
jgi:2-alkenal reductase